MMSIYILKLLQSNAMHINIPVPQVHTLCKSYSTNPFIHIAFTRWYLQSYVLYGVHGTYKNFINSKLNGGIQQGIFDLYQHSMCIQHNKNVNVNGRVNCIDCVLMHLEISYFVVVNTRLSFHG